ncbi:hypothetical protein ACVNPX_07580 [Staphylococcus aureus]
MTHDYIVKALAFDGEIISYAALTTETVQRDKPDIIHGRQHLLQWKQQLQQQL